MQRRIINSLRALLIVAGAGTVLLALAADRIFVTDSQGYGPAQVSFVVVGVILIFASLGLRVHSVNSWLQAHLPAHVSRNQVRIIAAQLVASTILALLLAEVAIRLTAEPYAAIVGNVLRYESTIFSSGVLAQAEVLAEGPNGVYPINDLGYRGDHFEVQKAPGVTRIVFMGGSQVFDLERSDFEDWPHQVQDRLAADGYDVEVINAGIPGHRTFDAVGRLWSEIWMFDPDYVVLDVCWNDIKYFTELSPSQSLLRLIEPYTPDPRSTCIGWLDCLLGHSELYLRLRYFYLRTSLNIDTEGAVETEELQSSFGETGPEQYRLNVALFVDAARDIGAIPILIKQPRLASPDNTAEERQRIKYEFASLDHDALLEAFAACDEAIESVAEDKDVLTLDLSAEYTGRGDLIGDHIHLTSEGSAVISQAVAEYLETSVLPPTTANTTP